MFLLPPRYFRITIHARRAAEARRPAIHPAARTSNPAFAFAGATAGAVAGASEYLISGGLTTATGGEWQFSAQALGERAGWSALLGGTTGEGGYAAGRVISRLLGPRLIGRLASDGETFSLWNYRGHSVRISSGHGMINAAQAAKHGFTGAGLTVNQVERAIVRDVVGQVRVGNLAHGARGAPFDIAVNGYTIRYHVTYLVERLYVPTFYIP